MRWAPRWLSGALALAFAAISIGFTVGSASAAAAQPALTAVETTGGGALSQAAECAAEGKSILVQIVADASGSLRNTDPENRRISAVDSVLNSLERLSVASGGLVAVDVSLATFGENYREVASWGSISDPAHRARLADAARGLGGAKNDKYTDYRHALDGATASLEARAAAYPADGVCKLLVWFTDGQLDVDDNPADQAPEAAVLSALCDAGGTVDGLRNRNVSILALALFSNEISQDDQDILRAIAEGEAGGFECGTARLADGSFLRAEDAGALNFVFAGAASSMEGLVEGDGLACNASGACALSVDAGVFQARVLVDRSLDDGPITVVSPSGKLIDVRAAATQDVDGARIVAQTSPGLSTIDIVLPGGTQEDTTWLIDARGAAMRAFFGWGVHLDVDAASGLERGKTTTFRYFLEAEDLSVVDPALYRSVTVDQTAGLPSGVQVSVDAGASEVSVTIPDDEALTEIRLRLRATAVTRTNGYALGPIVLPIAIAVVPPGSPTVVTGSLNFGLISDPSVGGAATLILTGAEGGATQACFGDVNVAGAPSGAGDVTISVQNGVALGANEHCIELPQNATVEVPLVLTADRPADGRVSGTMTVNLWTVNGQLLPTEVRFASTLARPVDGGLFTLALIGLILLSIAIAWLTALLSRHFADRFRFGPGAQYAAVDVLIAPHGLTRADQRPGDLLDAAEDFNRVSAIGTAATAANKEIAGLKFSRTMPWNPWQPARGVVKQPGRIVAYGEHLEMVTPDGSLAPAPFPGTTGFILSVDPSDVSADPIPARLIMVVDAPHGVSEVLPDRLAALKEVQWSDAVQSLKQAAEARGAQDSESIVEREISRATSKAAAGAQVSDLLDGDDLGDSGYSAAPRTVDFLGVGEAGLPPVDSPSKQGKWPRRKERRSKSSSESAPDDTPRSGGTPPPMDFLS